MQVVILCGGMGTRAYPHTDYLPKPMMPVAGQPILMHVMDIFASQGITDFVLSLGHREEVIRDYFHRKVLDWNVELVSTGKETDTAGRIEKCKDILGDTFMATYADGLAKIDLHRLLDFHRAHPGLATVTTTPLVSQYGTLEFDESGKIESFKEKPTLREHWINAGFFVFDKEVFNHWEGTNLEQHVLPSLTAKDLCYAYQNDGFFKSMDTFKDQLELENMFAQGQIAKAS